MLKLMTAFGLFSYISSHTNLSDIYRCQHKWDQNGKSNHYERRTKIAVSFIWEPPPPPPKKHVDNEVLPLTQLYISSISCGPSFLSKIFKSSKNASPFKVTTARCEGSWSCSVQLLTVNSLILRPFLKISRCVVRHTNTKWDHKDLGAGKTLMHFLDEAETLTARCSSPLPSCWNKLKMKTSTRSIMSPIVMKSCLTVTLLR